MSIDEPPSILKRWLKDRTGIRISQDYLRSWYADHPKPISDFEAAYNEILTDFLHKDMSLTSQPVIQDDFGQMPVHTFPLGHLQGGVVLQIQDTNDISNSTFSLLNSLHNLTPVRQTYVERAVDEEVTLPRGMLRWTLTDGTKQIQAMEMETIPDLNLKTPFGCKLLIKNCQVKRGMLLFYKNGIQVLGGDVPELYGGNMIAELEKRFKTELGMIVQSNTTREPAYNNNMPSLVNNSHPPQQNSNAIDEFDEFDDDEMIYSAIEQLENRTMDADMHESSMPSSDPVTAFSDDDDFVQPSFSPMRSDAPKSSPSSSHISLSKSKSLKKPNPTTQPSQAIPSEPPTKRTRHSEPIDSSFTNNSNNGEEEDDSDLDLDWVDPDLWKNLNYVKQEGVTIDKDGNVHYTFEVMAKKLKALENDMPSGELADIVFFNLEIKVADPDRSDSETFNVVINDDVLTGLLGKSKSTLMEIARHEDGRKRIKKEIFQPFQRKVLNQKAIFQLDTSFLQTRASEEHSGKTTYMPVVIGYESCAP
ncbi:recQ-mediated genome instability protein 1 [Rhizopus stolonifer]|uniref:RecQ-mediated genome instability protein 1 n=1 Tax=Rhizopus stolonifer TaxID=4846 RepID=A0A367KNQ1_RHIST|nr:recQ-mediated genome instability protein 1 [Rhizopus stolonifer]